MNKKISTPIAIGIILILAVIVGGYTLWQYSELINLKIQIIDIIRKDMTCDEKCKSLGYLSGNCKTWAVLPDVSHGCNSDEASVGGALDCKIERISGLGRQCCCKTGIASFEDCINKGYPILESYPRQCYTPDGRDFVEKTKDETAGWKTYKNEEYGFEIDYPLEWSYKIVSAKEIEFREKGKTYEYEGSDIYAIGIFIYENPNNLTAEQITEEKKSKTSWPVEIRTLTINNIDVAQAIDYLDQETIIVKDKKEYKIVMPNGLDKSVSKIYDQMLSTFKFIEKETKTEQQKILNKYDIFAKCLTDSGAKMYGASWCPHCNNQKATFGSSWNYVNYIECALSGGGGQASACQKAGITAYPTWEFQNGKKITGELSFAQLSQYSGCKIEE